jgi:hypothetical protein
MHNMVIPILAILIMGSAVNWVAFFLPRADACVVDTYRCDPAFTHIEVCDTQGQHVQALCSGATCKADGRVPHCH